jgi:hypothetical protein
MLNPLNRSSHTGSPGSGAAWLLAARAWLARHWQPHAIPRGAVRLGAVRASVWPRWDWLSRSGSRRIGCGYASMWPPVHHPTRVYISDPRFSTKCL